MRLTIGLAVRSDWLGLVISGVAALVSGLTLLLCWRFVGAGFGDVRLATLGGHLSFGFATMVNHNALRQGVSEWTTVGSAADFEEGLPAQFAGAFGHPIEQGTAAEFRQARDLMVGSVAA